MAEPLVLRFRADAGPAISGVKSLASSVATSTASMSTSMQVMAAASTASTALMQKAAASDIGRMIAAIASLRMAVVAGATLALASAFQTSKERLLELTAVFEKAKSLDVGTTFLQAWSKQFEKLKLDAEDAEQALKHFQKAATDGFDSKAFETKLSALRQKLDDLFLDRNVDGKARRDFIDAKNNEERIGAVIRAIQELQREGQKLAAIDLAEAAWGAKGRDIAAQIEAGKVAIDSLGRTGLADGSIISPEVIAKAKELTERLDKAWETARDGLRPILADIVALSPSLYNVGVVLAEGLAIAATQAGKTYEAVKLILGIYKQFAGEMAAAVKPRGMGDFSDAELSEGVERAQRSMNGPWYRREMGDQDRFGTFSAEIERRRRAGLQNMASGRVAERSVPIGIDAPLPPRPDRPGAKTGGGKSASEDIDHIEKLIEAMQRANGVLAAEVANYGKSNVEKEKSVALAKLEATEREKGVTASEQERQKIIALAEAQGALKDAMAKVQKERQSAIELQNFIGQSITGFLSDIVSGGKNAAEAMMNLTKRLADAALQAALLGSGPLAGLFGLSGQNGAPGGLIGALFGGFKLGGGGGSGGLGLPQLYASGGFTGAGGKYEPAGIVHRGEYVFDADATGRIGVDTLERLRRFGARGYAAGGLVGGAANFAGMGVGGDVTVNMKLDLTGANGDETIARIAAQAARRGAAAAIDAANRNFPGRQTRLNLLGS